MAGRNASSREERNEGWKREGRMGAGLHGQEREMSLLHSVVFHMGGKVHTVRFVPLHMHACAFQKRTKNPPTVEHTPMHVHTLPADV